MSTTTTTAAATCTGNIYVMPVTDAACAVPAKSNYTDALSSCCKPASATSYNNDCAYYCLAEDQSVGNLTSCLTSNGVKDGDVFCNAAQTATATASVTSSTGTSTSTKTGASASSTGDKNGAFVMKKEAVGKAGMGVLAVMAVSVFMGAF